MSSQHVAIADVNGQNWCKQSHKVFPARGLIAVIMSVGALFALLAAYNILPGRVNVLSGVPGKVLGFTLFAAAQVLILLPRKTTFPVPLKPESPAVQTETLMAKENLPAMEGPQTQFESWRTNGAVIRTASGEEISEAEFTTRVTRLRLRPSLVTRLTASPNEALGFAALREDDPVMQRALSKLKGVFEEDSALLKSIAFSAEKNKDMGPEEIRPQIESYHRVLWQQIPINEIAEDFKQLGCKLNWVSLGTLACHLPHPACEFARDLEEKKSKKLITDESIQEVTAEFMRLVKNSQSLDSLGKLFFEGYINRMPYQSFASQHARWVESEVEVLTRRDGRTFTAAQFDELLWIFGRQDSFQWILFGGEEVERGELSSMDEHAPVMKGVLEKLKEAFESATALFDTVDFDCEQAEVEMPGYTKEKVNEYRQYLLGMFNLQDVDARIEEASRYMQSVSPAAFSESIPSFTKLYEEVSERLNGQVVDDQNDRRSAIQEVLDQSNLGRAEKAFFIGYVEGRKS